MIDAAEPLSLVIWAVFAFAAGLYPLGFMLGSPCSPCCGGDEEWFEFNRCIRFVNVDTSAPRTSYSTSETVDTPLHGFSRTVSRPEEVGARRVATKLTLPFSIVVDSSAMALSDGETRTGVYALKYNAPDGQQDAVQWTVTLQGVTMPFTLHDSELYVQVDLEDGPVDIQPYPIGPAWISVNAARSVSVYSAEVLFTDSDGVPSFGAQFLDGTVVTESALKAMLTAHLPEVVGSERQAALTFTPSQALFRYVPNTAHVFLRYVIEHAKGNTRRYKVLRVRVTQDGTPDPVPPGGLTPPSFSPPPYVDTPTPSPAPPVFGGSSPLAKTATVYSTSAGQMIECPPVEISPTGQLLRTQDYSKAIVTAAEHLTILQPSTLVNGSALEHGWIMRPFDPFYGTYSFNYPAYSTLNAWIYDTERVADWLNGEGTVPYNSGQLISPTDSSWTMQVSDPVAFCGKPLCNTFPVFTASEQRFSVYPATLSKTVTFTPSVKHPQTYTISTDDGTTSYTNLCYGQDTLEPMSLRLGSGCGYSGDRKTCQSLLASHAGNYGAETNLIRNVSHRFFYCGDLLWVIENGPCRQSLTRTGTDWYNCGTYALDGDDGSLWAGDWMCYDVNGKHRRTPKFPNGKCPPLEVEVDITSNIKLGNGYNTTSDSWRQAGTISSGTYAVLLANESDTSGFSNPYGNCNFQSYRLQITSGSGWIPGVSGSAVFGVSRSRTAWCSAWGEWQFDCFQGSSFGAIAIYFHPFTTNSNGSNQFFTPVAGTDFDVLYEEVDPVPTSVSPQNSQVPREGGAVTLQRCCPQRTEVVTIPPHAERFAREILLEAAQALSSQTVLQVTRGATAYVTQAGYDGVECPFTVMWLSGSVISLGSKSRAFAATGEPIMGQINHSEQPGCPWSVVESANWIVAEQTVDGLLKVSINGNVAAVYGPSDSKYTHPYREATVTISSGGSTDTWEIVQFQP